MAKNSSFQKNPKSGLGEGSGGDMGAMADLNGLGLDNITPDNKPVPPGSRLSGVKEALSIYHTLKRADERSSIERARQDAMFDGAPPHDPAKLRATRQEQRTNLNFGQAQRILDIALSAYVDLYTSLETLINVRVRDPQPDEHCAEKKRIVEEEYTRMMRGLPDFHSNYLRLCTTFLKHGVGITFFDTPDHYKFRVGGFDDLLIPRQTPASEDAIDIAVARRHYYVHELFGFIKDEAAAKQVGWNVNEVKRALKKNVRTTGPNSTTAGTTQSDYQALQALIKNNDIYVGIENPTVTVLHFWVRETDGTISHFMALENGPEDWLYKKTSRFPAAEHAYIFFTNGVGSNGTYHSIRGLGQRIYALIQESNKMRGAAVEGAKMSSSVMLQPENQRALDELEFTYYGAYALLSPNVNIIDKGIPNMTQAVMPVLNDLTDQLLQNTDTVTAYGPDRGSPYRNQMQVASDLEITSRISGASINLFYLSWSRLQREVFRRVVEFKKSDPHVDRFRQRCLERGIGPDFLARLDLDLTEATRSVGNGSVANRIMVQKELAAISHQFDEVGQRNLTRDTVASLVGYELTDRYTPRTDTGERPTIDDKVAMIENSHMEQGDEMPVLSNEMHGKHLRVHGAAVQQLLTGIEEGAVELVQALPLLIAFYKHLDAHVQYAGENPNLMPEINATRQLMQFLEEQINNGQKAQMKLQREAQEQAEAGGGEAPVPSPEELKLRQAEVAMDIADRKARQEEDIRNRRFEQDQALKDAEVAAKIRREEAMAEAKRGGGVALINRLE